MPKQKQSPIDSDLDAVEARPAAAVAHKSPPSPFIPPLAPDQPFPTIEQVEDLVRALVPPYMSHRRAK